MNLLDYVEWRGDLNFEKSAFCEVDALILCQLSYLNFDKILSAKISEKISLKTLWNKFKNSADFETRCDLGAMISKSTIKLFELCAECERFGKILACAYVNKIDLACEEQFCAITFFFPAKNKKIFVAFRGTDDTIVGWKEDFNLASKDTVPAQKDALEYLNFLAKNTREKIFTGGHSKGGNLAIFASAFIEKKFQKKIEAVYNFDGPGFHKELIKNPQMQNICRAVRSFCPEFSIVGRLFFHTEKSQVVKSEAFGIMQHEPFSWHIRARGFEQQENFDKKSEFFYKTFNEWVETLSKEQRELFTETLFNVISAGGARTNRELEKNWFKNSCAALKAMGMLDKKTKEEILRLLKHLFDTARSIHNA